MSEMEFKVKDAPTCPHCNAVMEKLDARYLDWGLPYLWVCYNDYCTFFKRGWQHMMENYGQLVSYRCMIQPDTGAVGVIPAFSFEYLREHGRPGDTYKGPED